MSSVIVVVLGLTSRLATRRRS